MGTVETRIYLGRIYRGMRGKFLATALATAAALLLLSAAPAAAEVSIEASVDGEQVADGDAVDVGEVATVEVEVDSDSELNFVRTSLGTHEYTVGVNSTSFRVNQTVTALLGDNSYRVYAEDVDGESASLEVTLERPPANEAEYRQVVRQYRSQLAEMQQEMNELENRSEDLSSENERLRQQVEDLESQVEEDDGLLPQPGFGFVAALAALLAITAARRR